MDEVLEVVDSLDTSTQSTQSKQLSLDQLKTGYVVGLTPEGEFVFELVGKDQGLVEVLGLHQYAGLRVNVLADLNQGLVGTMVRDLMKHVATLTQELAKLTTGNLPSVPRKGTNSLR